MTRRVPRIGCLGAAILAGFVLVAGFIVLLVVDALTGPHKQYQRDDSASIQATITSAAPRPGRTDEGWVEYTYTYDGVHYRDGAGYFTFDWKAADGLTVCVDPRSPTDNVPLIVPGPRCGDEDLKSSNRIAEKIG